MILNKKNLIFSVVSFLVITGCLVWSYKKGQEDIQAKWDAYALSQAQEYIKVAQESAAKQERLNTDIEQLREKHDNVTQELRSTVSDLNNRLRERPERPTVNNRMPKTTSSEPDTRGCTGKQLYKEDGQFLIRESERADTIKSLLIECRSAYDSMVN